MDVRKKINKNKTMGNKYICYRTDVHGLRHPEGEFVVIEETDEMLKLRSTRAYNISIFKNVGDILLPKEGTRYNPDGLNYFVKNPQYWQRSIQVHLGDHPFAFIFEPQKRYVIELEDAQKQLWLEEFLDDNKIDYIC